MALQPAAGARDLNPGQVDRNRRLCAQLATIYRLWGYQEVAPPAIEHLDTLQLLRSKPQNDVLRLASEEPLGLRPELTAPIVRAASTRLGSRPRPLRLWAEGSIFRTFTGDGGGQRISERLQSGVELLGVRSAAADAELMRLLLACTETLGLKASHRPLLLVGHHGVLGALLDRVPAEQRHACRQALTDFNPLGHRRPGAAARRRAPTAGAAAAAGASRRGCCRSCSGNWARSPCSRSWPPPWK